MDFETYARSKYTDYTALDETVAAVLRQWGVSLSY